MRHLSKAVVLAASVILCALAVSPYALAAEQDKTPNPRASKPKFADLQIELNENDEIAALEAIRVALSEVADGASYVWHRWHGRLSGIVQPTASFKDPAGRVCRHIVLSMVSTARSARVEGIACRLNDGRWQLEG